MQGKKGVGETKALGVVEVEASTFLGTNDPLTSPLVPRTKWLRSSFQLDALAPRPSKKHPLSSFVLVFLAPCPPASKSHMIRTKSSYCGSLLWQRTCSRLRQAMSSVAHPARKGGNVSLKPGDRRGGCGEEK